MEYLHWQEKIITDFSDKNISSMYDQGFVFTRIGKGVMHQTRSVRIDLKKFELTSENRRILKKTDEILLRVVWIPEDMKDAYDWHIHKMAYNFYLNKFNEKIFSANKIKALLIDETTSNFNRLCAYSHEELLLKSNPIGYTICYANEDLLHYSYPFYDLDKSPKDMGLGMMIRAIAYAKSAGAKYIYLGSLQRPNDTYKLQFEGIEWFDGKEWKSDVEEVKKILK